ncbi:hypothetical protein MPER_07233 [Moniliophthora perniciosa FA553]|nr:hypothetical protein MPER_07233 [Moniliophthora perniciosa FA553]
MSAYQEIAEQALGKWYRQPNHASHDIHSN